MGGGGIDSGVRKMVWWLSQLALACSIDSQSAQVCLSGIGRCRRLTCLDIGKPHRNWPVCLVLIFISHMTFSPGKFQ